MLSISMSGQLLITLYSAVMGIFFGVLYDAVCILRILTGVIPDAGRKAPCKLKPPAIIPELAGRNSKKKGGDKWKTALIAIGDLLFFTLAGLAFAVFLYHANDSHVRWYLLVGCAAGFFAYHKTVGRAVMALSGYIVYGLRYVGICALWALILPFRLMIRGTVRLVVAVREAVVRPLAKRIKWKKCLKNTLKEQKMLAEAVKL